MSSVNARPPVSEEDRDVHEASGRFEEDCQTIVFIPPLGGAENQRTARVRCLASRTQTLRVLARPCGLCRC